MTIDRRATCTRCFVYGDVRSVESTLEQFDTWRDPRDPRRRVATLVLSGDPLHVLATAQGIRDLERLRGVPFGFDLAASRSVATASVPSPCDERAHPFADDAGAPILLVDADESMERTARGRRALALVTVHALERRAPLVIVLREQTRLAPSLARALDARPTLDVVRFDGHNPFLLPAVEGFFAERAPRHIAVGGQGPRLLSAAIGAGDFFLERAGDPSHLSRHVRQRLAQQACIVHAFSAGQPPFTTVDLAAELQRLGVRLVDATFAGDPDGILVHPIAA